MVRLETPVCEFGKKAIDFSLPGVDGRQWTLQQCRGRNGLLIVFISNHCPYVKAIRNKLVRDTRELMTLGINSVAIMPNLLDETQEVARAYGAVCTPDFFGYNADLELQYRGRLDAAGPNDAPDDLARELFEAMKMVAETGNGPERQIPSMGCSIKWRE